jgi:peptidoglycan-associated lipoprotein
LRHWQAAWHVQKNRPLPTWPPATLSWKKLFKNIPFNYDQFSLTPQACAILDNVAEWMKSNTAKMVLIEGHCDERGTNEYNLALGDRRANSAKTYLMQLGVDSARIYTISYGEERPLAVGSTEAAWSKNRRGEFKLK